MAGFWTGVHWGMGFSEAAEEKAKLKRCARCGRKIPAGYRYCPYCGASQTEARNEGDFTISSE